MKLLVKVILGMVVVFSAILGGLYYYSTTVEEKLVLQVNIEDLANYKYSDKSTNISNVSFSATSVSPLLNSGDPVTQNVEESQTYYVDVPNNKVTGTSDLGQEFELTIAEYDAANPFVDFDTWKTFIDNEDYKVTETDDDWTFTISDPKVTNIFMDLMVSEVKREFALETSDDSIALDLTNLTFEGNINYTFLISKKDYMMQKAEVTADAPITMDFKLSGPTIDATLEDLKKQGVELTADDMTFSFKIENYQSISESKDVVLKPGKDFPANPLLLFLGTSLGI